MPPLDLEHWSTAHWFVTACALLAAEVLGFGGYLLCLATGAGVVALLTWVLGLSWDVQWWAFGILSVLGTFLWWYRFKPHQKKRGTSNRIHQYVGRTFVLSEAVLHGQGAVLIGDTRWAVLCEEDLPEGTPVKIIGAESISLKVVPVQGSEDLSPHGPKGGITKTKEDGS